MFNDVKSKESVQDKGTRIINEYYRANKLLTTRKLFDEVGVSGQYAKAMEEKLLDYGVVVIQEFKDGKYFYPIRAKFEKPSNGLREYTEQLWLHEEDLKNQEANKLKQDEGKQLVASLKKIVAFPSVQCSCGQHLDAGVTWQQGSLNYARVGLDTFVGSVTCSKCKTQVYWGFAHCRLAEKVPDKTIQNARSLGVSLSSLLPNKGLNELFSKIWQSIGGSGNMVFMKPDTEPKPGDYKDFKKVKV
ncbi:MAG: hypothetical protein WCW13_03510 [archaeon]|jgi:hypothetical protein